MTKPRMVKRGEIYFIDWGMGIGPHPALIIQNDTGNEWANSTIVAYITDADKPDLPLIVKFKPNESALAHGGAVDLGRIMWVPKSKLGERVGSLSTIKMVEVNQALKFSLALE